MPDARAVRQNVAAGFRGAPARENRRRRGGRRRGGGGGVCPGRGGPRPASRHLRARARPGRSLPGVCWDAGRTDRADRGRARRPLGPGARPVRAPRAGAGGNDGHRHRLLAGGHRGGRFRRRRGRSTQGGCGPPAPGGVALRLARGRRGARTLAGSGSGLPRRPVRARGRCGRPAGADPRLPRRRPPDGRGAARGTGHHGRHRDRPDAGRDDASRNDGRGPRRPRGRRLGTADRWTAVAATGWPAGTPAAILYHDRGYVLARGGDALLGTTMEHAGFDCRVTNEGLAQIFRGAVRLLPALLNHAVQRMWAGLRPMTGDGRPIVGPDPDVERLWYAAGHGRNGILLAALTGEIIADLVTKGETDVDISALSIERFTTDT